MLLPSPHKKSDRLEAPPQLETPERVTRSIERDQALSIRAQRQQEENTVIAGRIENDDRQFELTRKKIIFSIEFLITAISFISLLIVLFTNPALVPISLLSGSSGMGGMGLLLRRSGS